MKTENSAPKGAEQAHSHAPAGSSPLRLVVLLSVLVVVAGALVYDWVIAPPRVKAAFDKLHDTVLEHNEIGLKLPKSKTGDSSPDIKAEGLLYSPDIQKILGMAPTKVEKNDLYTIETYSWWGWIPRKSNFITVLYIGSSDKPHYATHYANEMPEDGAITGKWKNAVPDIDITAEAKEEKAGFPMRPPGGGMGSPGMGPSMNPPSMKGGPEKMAPPGAGGSKGKGRPPGDAEKKGSEPTGTEEKTKQVEEAKKEASGEGEKKEPTKAKARESL